MPRCTAESDLLTATHRYEDERKIVSQSDGSSVFNYQLDGSVGFDA